MNYNKLNDITTTVHQYASNFGVNFYYQMDSKHTLSFIFRYKGSERVRNISEYIFDCSYTRNGLVIEFCLLIDDLVKRTKTISPLSKLPNEPGRLQLKKVIYSGPATIAFWDDGTKTVVKCGDNDIYDEEKGLAMATLKKLYGKKDFYKFFKNAEKVKVDRNKKIEDEGEFE